MKNSELAMHKLELLEGKLTTLSVMLTRPVTTDQYREVISQCTDIVEDLKTMVERN